MKDLTKIKQQVRELFPELDWIAKAEYREAVVDIWAEVFAESDWEHLEDAPKSQKVTKVSTVAHTRSVTQQAYQCAKIIEAFYSVKVDYDILITAALLHDVSKLVEYGQSGATELGTLMQHAVYGAHKAFAHKLPVEVSHLIVSHTHASRLMLKTMEAIVLHYVDYLDTDALLHHFGQPLLLNK